MIKFINNQNNLIEIEVQPGGPFIIATQNAISIDSWGTLTFDPKTPKNLNYLSRYEMLEAIINNDFDLKIEDQFYLGLYVQTNIMKWVVNELGMIQDQLIK